MADNISGESFKMENITFVDVYDNILLPNTYTESLYGRYYIGSLGYLDISTQSPLVYTNYPGSNPSSGGPMIITNGTSSIRITPIDSLQVRIEVNADGDSVYESNVVYNWSDF